MTPKARRQALIAGGVIAVLAGVAYFSGDAPAPADGGAAASNTVAGGAQAGGAAPVVDVQLELLTRAPVEAGEPERNPFRFQAKAPPPAPPRPAAAAAPPPAPAVNVPPVPQGPPPPPPIPLRFIGLVDAPTQGGRVAILSDGRGNVFYGKEGEIIEGRYRLLRVGPDAADLSYTDGRGRQTIRLSGQ
jgi:hypothetical protein